MIFSYLLVYYNCLVNFYTHIYTYTYICIHAYNHYQNQYKNIFKVPENLLVPSQYLPPEGNVILSFIITGLVLSVFVLLIHGDTMCTFLPIFCTTLCLPDLSVLLHRAKVHSFSLQCCIPSFEYSSLFTHSGVMDNWVNSSLKLL